MRMMNIEHSPLRIQCPQAATTNSHTCNKRKGLTPPLRAIFEAGRGSNSDMEEDQGGGPSTGTVHPT